MEVELPDSLGFYLQEHVLHQRSVNTNYALSQKYGKVLQNKNWETDGNQEKYFIQTGQLNIDLKIGSYGDFVACRDFKRTVAKEYPKNWTKYVVMKNNIQSSSFI